MTNVSQTRHTADLVVLLAHLIFIYYLLYGSYTRWVVHCNSEELQASTYLQ